MKKKTYLDTTTWLTAEKCLLAKTDCCNYAMLRQTLYCGSSEGIAVMLQEYMVPISLSLELKLLLFRYS